MCLSESGQIEKQLEDVSLARRDLEDSSKHIKTLEKQMRSITQERDDLHKVEPVFYGVCVRANLYFFPCSLQPDYSVLILVSKKSNKSSLCLY